MDVDADKSSNDFKSQSVHLADAAGDAGDAAAPTHAHGAASPSNAAPAAGTNELAGARVHSAKGDGACGEGLNPPTDGGDRSGGGDKVPITPRGMNNHKSQAKISAKPTHWIVKIPLNESCTTVIGTIIDTKETKAWKKNLNLPQHVHDGMDVTQFDPTPLHGLETGVETEREAPFFVHAFLERMKQATAELPNAGAGNQLFESINESMESFHDKFRKTLTIQKDHINEISPGSADHICLKSLPILSPSHILKNGWSQVPEDLLDRNICPGFCVVLYINHSHKSEKYHSRVLTVEANKPLATAKPQVTAKEWEKLSTTISKKLLTSDNKEMFLPESCAALTLVFLGNQKINNFYGTPASLVQDNPESDVAAADDASPEDVTTTRVAAPEDNRWEVKLEEIEDNDTWTCPVYVACIIHNDLFSPPNTKPPIGNMSLGFHVHGILKDMNEQVAEVEVGSDGNIFMLQLHHDITSCVPEVSSTSQQTEYYQLMDVGSNKLGTISDIIKSIQNDAEIRCSKTFSTEAVTAEDVSISATVLVNGEEIPHGNEIMLQLPSARGTKSDVGSLQVTTKPATKPATNFAAALWSLLDNLDKADFTAGDTVAVHLKVTLTATLESLSPASQPDFSMSPRPFTALGEVVRKKTQIHHTQQRIGAHLLMRVMIVTGSAEISKATFDRGGRVGDDTWFNVSEENLCKKFPNGVEFLIFVPNYTALWQQTLNRCEHENEVVGGRLFAGSVDTAKDRRGEGCAPPVLMCGDSKDRFAQHKAFSNRAKNDKKKLFVMIFDECHSSNTEYGAMDIFLNDVKRAGATLQLENVIPVLVSATPYNVLSMDSRVPEMYVGIKSPQRDSLALVVEAGKQYTRDELLHKLNMTCLPRHEQQKKLTALMISEDIFELNCLDWYKVPDLPPTHYKRLESYCDASGDRRPGLADLRMLGDQFNEKFEEQIIAGQLPGIVTTIPDPKDKNKMITISTPVGKEIILLVEYTCVLLWYNFFRWDKVDGFLDIEQNYDKCMDMVSDEDRLIAYFGSLDTFAVEIKNCSGLRAVMLAYWKCCYSCHYSTGKPIEQNKDTTLLSEDTSLLRCLGKDDRDAMEKMTELFKTILSGERAFLRGQFKTSKTEDTKLGFFTQTHRVMMELLKSSNQKPHEPSCGRMVVVRVTQVDPQGRLFKSVLTELLTFTRKFSGEAAEYGCCWHDDFERIQGNKQRVPGWRLFDVIGDYSKQEVTPARVPNVKLLDKLDPFFSRVRPIIRSHPAYGLEVSQDAHEMTLQSLCNARREALQGQKPAGKKKKVAVDIDYVDLHGIPCILVLCERGRMGDTFPHAFNLDMRIRSAIDHSTLIQELGRLCGYRPVQEKSLLELGKEDIVSGTESSGTSDGSASLDISDSEEKLKSNPCGFPTMETRGGNSADQATDDKDHIIERRKKEIKDYRAFVSELPQRMRLLKSLLWGRKSIIQWRQIEGGCDAPAKNWDETIIKLHSPAFASVRELLVEICGMKTASSTRGNKIKAGDKSQLNNSHIKQLVTIVHALPGTEWLKTELKRCYKNIPDTQSYVVHICDGDSGNLTSPIYDSLRERTAVDELRKRLTSLVSVSGDKINTPWKWITKEESVFSLVGIKHDNIVGLKQGLPVRLELQKVTTGTKQFIADVADCEELGRLFCSPLERGILQRLDVLARLEDLEGKHGEYRIVVYQHQYPLPYALVNKALRVKLDNAVKATANGSSSEFAGEVLINLNTASFLEAKLQKIPGKKMLQQEVFDTRCYYVPYKGPRKGPKKSYDSRRAELKLSSSNREELEMWEHPRRIVLKAECQIGKTGAYCAFAVRLAELLNPDPVPVFLPVMNTPTKLRLKPDLPKLHVFCPLYGELSEIYTQYKAVGTGKYHAAILLQRLQNLAHLQKQCTSLEDWVNRYSEYVLGYSGELSGEFVISENGTDALKKASKAANELLSGMQQAVNAADGDVVLRIPDVSKDEKDKWVKAIMHLLNWDGRLLSSTVSASSPDTRMDIKTSLESFITGVDGLSGLVAVVRSSDSSLTITLPPAHKTVQHMMWSSTETNAVDVQGEGTPGQFQSVSNASATHSFLARKSPSRVFLSCDNDFKTYSLSPNLKICREGERMFTAKDIFPSAHDDQMPRFKLHKDFDEDRFKLTDVGGKMCIVGIKDESPGTSSTHPWVFVPTYKRHDRALLDLTHAMKPMGGAHSVHELGGYIRVLVVRPGDDEAAYSRFCSKHTVLLILPNTITLDKAGQTAWYPQSQASSTEPRLEFDITLGIGFARLTIQLVAGMLGMPYVWLLDGRAVAPMFRYAQ
jgi:hypothetical protein